MKLLIAEDEPPTARALAALVAELLPEAALIAVARDGQEAIDLVEQLAPDLILTDIRMPLKTGIDLIRHCAGRPQPPDVIVISGYKDFEYVQEALRHGAVDYVLKPIDPDELAACFDRLRQVIASRQAAGNDTLLLPLLPDRPFPLSLAGLSFPLEALCLADSRLCPQILDQREPGGFIVDTKSLPDWLRVLAQIPGNPSPLHILLFGRAPGSPGGDLPPAILERLLAAQPLDCSASTLPLIANPTDLARLLGQLATRTLQSTVFGSRQRATDNPPGQSTVELAALRLVDEQAEAISHAVMVNSPGELASILAAMLDRLAGRSATTQELFLSLRHFLARCLPVGSADRETQLARLIASQTSYQAVLSGLEAIVDRLCQTLARQRSYHRPLVESVDTYLAANPGQNVTVQKIAAALGQEAEYLGRCFKKVTNQTLSQYITAHRMARAREYMERYPDSLVKQVARVVGYDDPLYFSRVFRATLGRWPSELLSGATTPGSADGSVPESDRSAGEKSGPND